MTIFAALVLTVAAFIFIAYPLFKQKAYSGASTGDEKFRELYSRRDTTYAMLKELEFDYQSGILTEEDYRDLEARYKRKAISILKDADELEKGGGAEEEIEAQVRKLRQARSTQQPRTSELEEEMEKEVASLRRNRGEFCPRCGAKAQEGDRFCAACGTKLR